MVSCAARRSHSSRTRPDQRIRFAHMDPEWKVEFIRLLSSAEQGDWAKAFGLKMDNRPGMLYRYRRGDERSIDAFRKNQMWFSPAARFNDLYDSGVKIDVRASWKGISFRDALTTQAEKLSPDALQRLQNVESGAELESFLFEEASRLVGIEKARDVRTLVSTYLDRVSQQTTVARSKLYRNAIWVACLSEDPVSRLMWAHYADNNRGFCIEHRIEPATPAGDPHKLLFPVVYTRMRFSQSPESVGQNPLEPFLAALHKHPDWAYEREWRYVDLREPTTEPLRWSIDTPTRIILGHSIPGRQEGAPD